MHTCTHTHAQFILKFYENSSLTDSFLVVAWWHKIIHGDWWQWPCADRLIFRKGLSFWATVYIAMTCMNVADAADTGTVAQNST